MKQNLYLSVGIAFFGGLGLTYIALICWGYIAVHTPVLRWLLDLGLQGTALRLVLFPIDFATNVAIALPFAALLVKLRPPKLGLFLAVAVVPSFVWLNFPLVGDAVFLELWPAFVPGWLHTLLALPVAAWLVSLVVKPGAPNNARQPTCENARA